MEALASGSLVVLRVRWNTPAGLLGLVVGCDWAEDPSWLVLWTSGDRQTQLQWHLADALTVVDDTNMATVKRRCSLAG